MFVGWILISSAYQIIINYDILVNDTIRTSLSLQFYENDTPPKQLYK